MFEEPSRVVVFDLAFVRESFFDLQSGSLIEKVTLLLPVFLAYIFRFVQT